MTKQTPKLEELIDSNWENLSHEDMQEFIKKVYEAGGEAREVTGETSDGYHTFNELYDHRIALFIALCFTIDMVECSLVETGELDCKVANVWRSTFHSDGTSMEGWFVMGVGKDKGKQITYHLPVSYWDKTDFAQTLDKAPVWDGHTAKDVVERLLKITQIR